MNVRTRLERLRRRLPPPEWVYVRAEDPDARQRVERAQAAGRNVVLLLYVDEERPDWFQPDQSIQLKWRDADRL